MIRAHSLGRPVYYPAAEASYLFSGSLTFSGGGIIGDGMGTVLHSTDTAAENAILCTNIGGDQRQVPVFRDFCLIGPNTPEDPLKKPLGAAIAFSTDADNGAQNGALISNVRFQFWPVCLNMSSAAGYSIKNCQFLFYASIGVLVENPVHPDVGDQNIEGSHFFNGNGVVYGTRGVAIQQHSSGGLRVVNNKFNGGSTHYLLDLHGSTSDFIFTSNSSENASACALVFENTANTSARPVRWQNTSVVGNQFGRNAADIQFREIPHYLNTSYWDNTIISGNAFLYRGQESSIALHCCRAFAVEANTWFGEGVGATAIFVDSSCHDGSVDNHYLGLARHCVNFGRSVATPSTALTGSALGRADRADGGVFRSSHSVDVRFPVPFETAPFVSLQARSGIAAVIESVQPQGFKATVFGASEGEAVAFSWRAEGSPDIAFRGR